MTGCTYLSLTRKALEEALIYASFRCEQPLVTERSPAERSLKG